MALRTNFKFFGEASTKPLGGRKLPSKSPQRNISKGPTKATHRPGKSLAATLPKKPLSLAIGGSVNTDDKPLIAGFLANSKNSTPKNADQRSSKSAKHRRFLSLADRPLSHNTLRKPEPEKTNRRKFSLEARPEVPVVVKYSHYTQTGFIPGNSAKVNQDSFFAHVNFANYPDLYFFGVCDGHGFYGGEVSGYVKQRLPALLSQHPSIYTNPRKALNSEILRCNAELSQINLDVNFSGTTLVCVLIKGSTLYCANVGDSRALIARQINDNLNNTSTGRHWMSIALSRDHKPDDKAESVRIMQCNGRVESYQDENGNPVGPARVWLKNQDLPGLAMSRSLGDAVAASVGVIAEPEILEFQLTSEDKFIIIGSDGIFEFLSNEEVVKIFVPYWKSKDIEGGCECLWREANTKWKTVRFI
jgi:serine/threonine protein phosphatase PrpC